MGVYGGLWKILFLVVGFGVWLWCLSYQFLPGELAVYCCSNVMDQGYLMFDKAISGVSMCLSLCLSTSKLR